MTEGRFSFEICELIVSCPQLKKIFLLRSRVKFKDPLYADDFVFKAALLPGAKWGSYFAQHWNLFHFSRWKSVFHFALLLKAADTLYFSLYFTNPTKRSKVCLSVLPDFPAVAVGSKPIGSYWRCKGLSMIGLSCWFQALYFNTGIHPEKLFMIHSFKKCLFIL